MELMDMMNKRQMRRLIRRGRRAARRYDIDDILHGAGLERRSIAADIFADLGFFTLGCVFGALAGVFFAPKPGAEIRDNIKKAIDEKGGWRGVGTQIRDQISGHA